MGGHYASMPPPGKRAWGQIGRFLCGLTVIFTQSSLLSSKNGWHGSAFRSAASANLSRVLIQQSIKLTLKANSQRVTFGQGGKNIRVGTFNRAIFSLKVFL
jgi:hypothetical protein